MSRSANLGELHEVKLSNGTLRYRERGAGEPLVFLHGLLVNGDLWRNVVPALAESYRCITPDLPLGAHDLPMAPDADLTPSGIAAIVREFLDALNLDRVTIVANDTGGGVAQLLIAATPERVERLILTPCDCFDIFPPKMFLYLKLAARIPGGLWTVAQSARLAAVRRMPIAFGWLAKRPIDAEAVRSYLEPCQRSAAIRRDTAKFCTTVHPRYTMAAAARLRRFTRPVLLAWAREDRLFPLAYAERLANTFPDARLELLSDCYTFVPEDRPADLARLIAEFVGATRASEAHPDAAAV